MLRLQDSLSLYSQPFFNIYFNIIIISLQSQSFIYFYLNNISNSLHSLYFINLYFSIIIISQSPSCFDCSCFNIIIIFLFACYYVDLNLRQSTFLSVALSFVQQLQSFLPTPNTLFICTYVCKGSFK